MLNLLKVKKVYSEKNAENVTALNGLTVNFGEHGLVFIVGKSGCGKTTLLNILAGMDTADEGDITVDGKNFKDFSPSDYDEYRNKYVGLVFQEYNLIDNFTTGENVALAIELQGKKADPALLDEILHKVALIDENTGKSLAERKISELSGGQKQRVAIARAIIKSPKLLLADEPTGALDGDTGRQIYELLKQLSKDMLVIVVSHDRQSAERYADRLIEMKDGRIISDETHNVESTEKMSDQESKQTAAICTSSSFGKPGLPAARIVSIGLNWLKAKKLKMILSVILAVITFAILGFSLTAAFADPLKTELDQLYQSGQKQVIIYNSRVRDDGMDYVTSFTPAQMEKINEYCGKTPPLIHSTTFYGSVLPINIPMSFNVGASNYIGLESGTPYERVASHINGLVELNPETGESDAHIRPDSRFKDKSKCRLPRTSDEIAITDMQADLFIKYGYVAVRDDDGDFKEENLIKINTPDDLIGKKIGEWDEDEQAWKGNTYTIVGVYSTQQSKDYIKNILGEEYDGPKGLYNDYISGVEISAERSLISCAFVKQGLLDEYMQNAEYQTEYYQRAKNACFLIDLSGNSGHDLRFINGLTDISDGQKYEARLNSAYCGVISNYEARIDWILIIGLAFAAVFLVFAILLMISFINVSIDAHKKDIGILRAMGAGKRDIAKICLSENAFLMFAQIIPAIIIAAVSCTALNATVFFVPVLRFGITQVLLLFAVCIAVNFIVAVVNIYKVTKQNPADIINDR